MRLLQTGNINAYAYAHRRGAYRQRGNLDRAIADYSKAIEIDPKDSISYGKRGIIYVRSRRAGERVMAL